MKKGMLPLFSLFLVALIAINSSPAGEIPLNTEWPFSEARARQLQADTAEALDIPIAYRLALAEDVEVVFVLIPAGEFEMGTAWARIEQLIGGEKDHVQRDRIRRESGPRRVRITRPFYMGKYESTQSQWSTVMGTHEKDDESRQEQAALPVAVSWAAICERGGFLEKMNQSDHGLPFEYAVFRLPTEAEWEYACRSGNTGDYAGTGVLDDMGWFADNSGGNPSPVGLKLANAWGLHDMHGNVAEWCSDRYMFAYSSPMLGSWIDPTGPKPQAASRIVRGGSWKSMARECRSASRESHWWRKSTRNDIGFRLVLSILPPEVIETEYRPAPGMDSESQDTIEYVRGDVKYIGTPVSVNRLKHANSLLYRDRSSGEYVRMWREAISQLNIVPADAPSLDPSSEAPTADRPRPGETAIYVIMEQLRAIPTSDTHCPNGFISYLKNILPYWEDHGGEASILMTLADLHFDDPDIRLHYHKSVTKTRNQSNEWGFEKQQAWQEIARYYEARGEYAKAIEALNNWVIREWCGTGAAASASRRWSWLLQLRMKLREDIPALKQEVWESMTRGRVGASEGIINAIIILYDHKLEDLMVDARKALATVGERGWDDRHKQMVRQSVKRLIDNVSLRIRLAGPEWRMTQEEARKRQIDEASRYGLPVEKSVTVQDEMMEFVLIPSGEFLIGSPPGEVGRIPPDEDQDRVRISRPFYMAKHEVTQAQWQAVMSANPSQFKNEERARHPVDSVSWNDIVKRFIPLIQPFAPESMRFDLPTEAQWEYACRAGTGTAFHFGDTLTTEMANIDPYGSLDLQAATMPVGSFPANAWGLHDMHGNVSEWCKDSFCHRFYRSHNHIAVDPINTTSSDRVVRGGGYLSVPKVSRSASRAQRRSAAHESAGFRLVLLPHEANESVAEQIMEYLRNGGELPDCVKGYDLTSVPVIEDLLLSPPTVTEQKYRELGPEWPEKIEQLRSVLASVYSFHADTFWMKRIGEVPEQDDLDRRAMLLVSMLPIEVLKQRLAQTAEKRRLEIILRILFQHKSGATMQLREGRGGPGYTHWVEDLRKLDAKDILAACERLWTVELEAPVQDGFYHWTCRAETAKDGHAENVIFVSINRHSNPARIVHFGVYRETTFNRDGFGPLLTWEGTKRNGRAWRTPSPSALMFLPANE